MAFPIFEYCVICEVVRPELGGKFILLGFYGVAPNVEIAIPDINRPVFLSFIAGSGPIVDVTTSYDWVVAVSRPDGVTIFQTPPQRLVVAEGKGVILPIGFNIAPPILTGRYSLRTLVNGDLKLDTSFAIRTGTPVLDINRQMSKASAPN